jgi:hypothetical protein
MPGPQIATSSASRRAASSSGVGEVHDAIASIPARAAALAGSKSSNRSPVASTIASATRSTYSGAARIAGNLSATLAQNAPKAALQRPANGTLIGSPGVTCLLKQLRHVAQQGDQAGQGRGLGQNAHRTQRYNDDQGISSPARSTKRLASTAGRFLLDCSRLLPPKRGPASGVSAGCKAGPCRATKKG